MLNFVYFNFIEMGRHSIGSTNIKFSTSMYNSCWRNMQTNSIVNAGYYGPVGGSPKNLSLCRFLNYQIWPYVTGTNNTVGQKGFDGGTNYSVETYWKGATAYAYYLTFINCSNNTITLSNPGDLNYQSPGFSGPNATTSVASGSEDTGKIGQANIANSTDSTYFRIASAPSPGYSFVGWYTSKAAGSLITNSTSYNCYYNFANVYNNAKWWARNQVSGPSYWSTTGGYDATSNYAACYSPGGGYTFYFQGSGPGNAMTVAGPVYINDSGTEYPSGYFSQSGIVRYWNNVSNNFFPASSCPSNPP
tara:strand:- start:176 stop:1087 length:912 start_codon:yes stop_codon:yes gene_type:complete